MLFMSPRRHADHKGPLNVRNVRPKYGRLRRMLRGGVLLVRSQTFPVLVVALPEEGCRHLSRGAKLPACRGVFSGPATEREPDIPRPPGISGLSP
jgi:hypothetical protein